MKKVILNLGTGTLKKGCESVMGEILDELGGVPSQPLYPTRFTGKLPAMPELAQVQQRWQQLYTLKHQDQSLRIRLIDVEGIRYSEKDFNRCCEQLIEQFDAWLNTPDFLNIDRVLRTELERDDDVQIILETTDSQIRKLPWHLWPLLADYTRAELTLSASDWRPLIPSSHRSAQSRILATFGNHDSLNLDADLAALKSLSNTSLDILESPSLSHLHETLWQPQGWDIFFFAGHSQTEGDTGVINLNPQERLNIAQIKHALSKAIANGLKIAIFNSCDGLGLAQQLSELQIPYVVVMREPVPDAIAQQFLRYLLTAFADGLPFHLAMREARQRLSGLENETPCASWLPIVWQNPTAPAIYWQDLQQPAARRPLSEPPSLGRPAAELLKGIATEQRLPTPLEPQQLPANAPHGANDGTHRNRRETLRAIALKSLAVSGVVLGLRALGILQSAELAAYDRLMTQRPAETVAEDIVVVEISQETTNKYQYPLPDPQLTGLIDRIYEANPLAIGLDLHRAKPNPGSYSGKGALETASTARPVETGYQTFLRQVETMPDLFLVCFHGSADENYGAPAQLDDETLMRQVGFSDIPIDRFDRFIGSPRSDLSEQGRAARPGSAARRQPLSYDLSLAAGPERCQAPHSFSLQLAYRYLAAMDVGPAEITAEEHWKIGPVLFKSLPQRIGGYQYLDPYSGQILLNYRTNQPGERLTYEQIEAGDFDASQLADKIVLVGYASPVSKDYFETPYGPMAGIWVHAHMVSQITAAVLDGRPLMRGLWQLGNWQIADWLFVLVWGCAGGYASAAIRKPSRWYLSLMLGLLALYGGCWWAIVQGVWLPLWPSALTAVGSSLWVRLNGYTVSDLDHRTLPPTAKTAAKPAVVKTSVEQ